MRPPTPEEKLLRLIRGKAARPQPAAGAPVQAAPVAAGRGMPWRVSGWQWMLVGTVILGLVLAVEVVLLIVQLTRPVPTIQISTPALPVDASQQPAAPESVEPIPSLAAAATRPVFSAPAITAGPGTVGAAPSQDAKQLSGRLTLTGIITGDPPQAIIEDSETKKTYFVSPGQVVVDGAVVERVAENRVTLSLQGEKIELGL